MLFTVSGIFSDFAVAYEQYDSATPGDALSSFLLTAPALADYDPKMREFAAGADGYRLNHVADGMCGLWAWHLNLRIEHEDISVYGGSIVQTGPSGPKRKSS